MRILIINFFLSISLFAQINVHKIEPVQKSNNTFLFNSPANESANYFFDKQNNVNAYSYDIEKKVDVIIQFKEEPFLVKKYLRGENVSENNYLSKFSNFNQDVSNITAAFSIKNNTINAQFTVTKEFHKLFNGVAASVSPVLFDDISQLSYVKKIYFDYEVKASLQESVPLIGADSVWVKYNSKGEGIVVGVLDTGIDYLHPFLGGGFGPGFRVIGGYDFINDDNDPMDDNFHGTHVAGIIGANGDTLKGVAPEVSFLAVKVLDENGSAPTSTIIEGVEYAMDPNGDGNLDDIPDIINLSLGGPGKPDSPLSQMINDAVQMGIIVCAAAGNAGKNLSIGSPGNASEAITVGAADNSDQLAVFSSMGPNSSNFIIKPDLVAPGVGILSTFPENRVEELNGTSMATPHVAGLAALLLSIHSDWGPKQVKSALKTSAIDIGEGVMAQGAGRINAPGAAEEDVFMYPSDLSFGIDETEQNVWEVTKTLRVYNFSNEDRQYNIVFNETIPGITISTTPQTISINQNDSLDVEVSLSVDNSQVPYLSDPSLTYGGSTLFYNDKDTLKIPWGFVKAARLLVNSEEPFPAIYISSKDYYTTSFDTDLDDLYNFEFLLPANTYDIAYLYNSGSETPFFIIKENIKVEGYVKLDFNNAEANNKVILQGVDEQNRKLVDRDNLVRDINILFPDSDYIMGFGVLEHLNSTDISVSDFSDRFKFLVTEYQYDIDTEKCVRILRHTPISGMDGDYTLANSSGDFINQKISYQVPPDESNHWLFFTYVSRLSSIYDSNHVYLGFNAIEQQVAGNNWEGELYITNEDPNIYFGKTSQIITSPDNNYYSTYNWFESPPVQAFDNKIGFFTGNGELNYFKPYGRTSTFGITPMFSNAFHINNWFGDKNISINITSNYGLEFYGGLDEYREIESSKAQYKILNNNETVIDSGNVFDFKPVDVVSGEYSVVVNNNNYYLGKSRGLSEVKSHFDLNKEDPNPPDIEFLRIMNPDSNIVNAVKIGENALIEFALGDIEQERTTGYAFRNYYKSINVDSTKLFFRVYGEETWQPLAFSSVREYPGEGILFSAEWENNLNTDSSGIDLMIQAQDLSGNSIQFVSKPAFLVGDKLVSINEDENNVVKSVPKTYSLSANYPNPFNPETNIQYTIPEQEFVTLKIYDVLGQEVRTLVNEIKTPGKYSVRFNGNGLSSGVYFYRIKAGDFSKIKKMILLK